MACTAERLRRVSEPQFPQLRNKLGVTWGRERAWKTGTPPTLVRIAMRTDEEAEACGLGPSSWGEGRSGAADTWPWGRGYHPNEGKNCSTSRTGAGQSSFRRLRKCLQKSSKAKKRQRQRRSVIKAGPKEQIVGINALHTRKGGGGTASVLPAGASFIRCREEVSRAGSFEEQNGASPGHLIANEIMRG